MGALYLLTYTACDYGDEIDEGSGMSAATIEPMVCTVCRRVVAVQTSPAAEHWVEPEGSRSRRAQPLPALQRRPARGLGKPRR